MKISDIKPEVFALASEAEKEIRQYFDLIDETAQKNTEKVMAAFQDNRDTHACFAGTTGYGYDDLRTEKLD